MLLLIAEWYPKILFLNMLLHKLLKAGVRVMLSVKGFGFLHGRLAQLQVLCLKLVIGLFRIFAIVIEQYEQDNV